MGECQQGDCIATEVKSELADLRARMEGMKEWTESLASAVKDLTAAVNAGRGAVRALIMASSAVAAFIAAGAWLWDHLK